VMVLCCSRHMFVRPTLSMDQAEWTAAHVEGFGYFDGVPARLVPENVPRNIFRLLWPGALCGRWRRTPRWSRVQGAASAT
jgi:transposase